MKSFTNINPVFSENIMLVETTDPVHSDNANAAAKQLLANTQVNKDAIEALKTSIGNTPDMAYDSKGIYKIGDYCIYNNRLYKCISAIEEAEEWNASHWEETTMTKEFQILNNKEVEVVDPMTATEEGFAADAKLTGTVLNELKTKMSSFEQAKSTIVSSALGKALGLAASTALAAVAAKIASVVNRGAWTGSTTAYNGKVTIPAGYHNGSGYVQASITNRGAWTGSITTANGKVTIPAGYHNGSGYVQASGLYVPPVTSSGSVSHGNLGAANTSTKTVVFSKPFATVPKVTASSASSNNKDHYLATSISSISKSGFVVTVNNTSGSTMCEGVTTTWTAHT